MQERDEPNPLHSLFLSGDDDGGGVVDEYFRQVHIHTHARRFLGVGTSTHKPMHLYYFFIHL